MKKVIIIILVVLLICIVSYVAMLFIATNNAIETVNSSKSSSLESIAYGICIEYKETKVTVEAFPNAFDANTIEIYNKVEEGNWFCINSIATNDGSTNLFDELELDGYDIVRDGTVYDGTNITQNTCASMKIVDNKCEILIVAEKDGKYSSKNTLMYGLSSTGS